MSRKKNGNMSPKPLKQPLPAIIYVAISFAGLLAGILLLFVYILKAPDLIAQGIDKSVYYVLLIPLGISASAFLFGAMNAYASYTGKVFDGKLVIIGPAVVFFLVIILGFMLPPRTGPFNFTIYLQDSEGKTVLKNRGMVRIRLGSRPETGQIDSHGAVDFKGIPARFLGSHVPVELEAKGWRFAGSEAPAVCPLRGDHGVLVIERDDSLTRLSGTVTDEDGRFINGAGVAIDDLTAATGENGWFTIEIPPAKQADKALLKVQKEGYRPYMDYAYPGSPSKLVIILQKEK